MNESARTLRPVLANNNSTSSQKDPRIFSFLSLELCILKKNKQKTLVPSRRLQLLHEDGPFEVPRQRREPNAVRPRALARDGVPRPGDEGRFDLGACVEINQ